MSSYGAQEVPALRRMFRATGTDLFVIDRVVLPLVSEPPQEVSIRTEEIVAPESLEGVAFMCVSDAEEHVQVLSMVRSGSKLLVMMFSEVEEVPAPASYIPPEEGDPSKFYGVFVYPGSIDALFTDVQIEGPEVFAWTFFEGDEPGFQWGSVDELGFTFYGGYGVKELT